MAPIEGKSKGKGRDVRSRNTTPISTASTEHSQIGTGILLPNMSYDQVLEQYCRGSSPPASATLQKIAENLRGFSAVAKARSDNCDRGMREFSKRRKDLVENIRNQELAGRAAEEERQERIRQSTTKMDLEDNRPLAVGAHSLARQDGIEIKGIIAFAETFFIRNSHLCLNTTYFVNGPETVICVRLYPASMGKLDEENAKLEEEKKAVKKAWEEKRHEREHREKQDRQKKRLEAQQRKNQRLRTNQWQREMQENEEGAGRRTSLATQLCRAALSLL